ncbi:DUF2218 domain-containing protein [Novosphingobium fluoreni]|uniref:DUF2218 domain-containing protein n=1 Tax=Novosphingobium fluoreni TaxID=1391222 RepID=UPI003D9FE10C
MIVEAHVPTKSGAKYVQQLCKHWSHKLPVSLEGDTGEVTFETAVASMVAGPDSIHVTIQGEDRAALERLTGVVAEHLDRFAFREAPLSFEWNWREG